MRSPQLLPLERTTPLKIQVSPLEILGLGGEILLVEYIFAVLGKSTAIRLQQYSIGFY